MTEIENLFNAVTALIASERAEYHKASLCWDGERRRTHHQTLALLVPPRRSLGKLLQQVRVALHGQVATSQDSRFATAGLGLARTLLECVVWKNGRTLTLSPAVHALPVTAALVNEVPAQLSSSGAPPWVPEGNTLGELVASFDAYCIAARTAEKAHAAARRRKLTTLLSRLEQELSASDWALLKSALRMP